MYSSDDSYDDDYCVNRRPAKIVPAHIEVGLRQLGRQLQRLLDQQPEHRLNICKLPEVYERYYGRQVDKLGYSKLIDCVRAVPSPVSTRNVRPHGSEIYLTGPIGKSCQKFQIGDCELTSAECEDEHECLDCGSFDHGAHECGRSRRPQSTATMSYNDACLTVARDPAICGARDPKANWGTTAQPTPSEPAAPVMRSSSWADRWNSYWDNQEVQEAVASDTTPASSEPEFAVSAEKDGNWGRPIRRGAPANQVVSTAYLN